MPLSGSAPESATPCSSDSIVAFAWSPDGQWLTYLVELPDWASNPAHAEFQWHLVSGGADRVIGTAPLWCHCGAGSDDNTLAVSFSADGKFVSLVDFLQFGSTVQIRRLDGSSVGVDIRRERNDPNPVTMGVWSGTDFFFRDSQGVQKWHAGAITQFLPGVAWLHPWASPAGGQIVYAARGSDGLGHVYVVDTVSGRGQQLSGQSRVGPVFLTARYVWYRGERLCTPNEPGICHSTTLTGKTYIFDLQSGAEWESRITAVADVWPHGV
jgi:hypothetical protein